MKLGHEALIDAVPEKIHKTIEVAVRIHQHNRPEKLAQALEYGALTIQVEANFDQILALVRELAENPDVVDLQLLRPNLETVFLNLTGTQLRDS